MSDSQEQQHIIKEKVEAESTSLHAWVAQNLDVLVKLATFTAALFAFPILTFFVTLHSLFDGNTTYAGGAAALMANVIVGLYVVVAMLERPKDADKTKDKKTN